MEITHKAKLSISSLKPGFGISNFNDQDSFWQSDGPQPHIIRFQFPHRQYISKLSVYIDYKQDESYSPKVISIRGGTLEMIEITRSEINVEVGWMDFPVDVTVFCLEFVILQNHQNGRDCHIRNIKIFTERYVALTIVALKNNVYIL